MSDMRKFMNLFEFKVETVTETDKPLSNKTFNIISQDPSEGTKYLISFTSKTDYEIYLAAIENMYNDSSYYSGGSDSWVTINVQQTADTVVPAGVLSKYNPLIEIEDESEIEEMFEDSIDNIVLDVVQLIDNEYGTILDDDDDDYGDEDEDDY
jgi:hypothetical protein